ncbi:putative membrane protein, partial [Yersinia pestis PY-66]
MRAGSTRVAVAVVLAVKSAALAVAIVPNNAMAITELIFFIY